MDTNIIIAVLASSGIWGLLQFLISRSDKQKSSSMTPHDNDFPVGLITNSNLTGFYGRFYGVKLYSGNTLLMDCVPAKKATDIGMYNKINQTFIISAGNTPFRITGDD